MFRSYGAFLRDAQFTTDVSLLRSFLKLRLQAWIVIEAITNEDLNPSCSFSPEIEEKMP